MKKIIISIILFSLFLNAQNIDDIKKQLNNSGITVDQAKSAAKSQGLTDQQIELEAKSKGIDLGEKSIKLKKNDSFEQDDPLIDELGYNDLSASDEYSNIENMSDGAIEYYGYKIFSGDPSAFQSSNFGAIHPNYNIGPGDQIIVMLWGESQFRQEFTIDREGYVFVPDVGQIFVNGLTLEALEKKFFQTLSKVYSTLKPVSGEPTTFMDISLGNLRPLRIIVLGEVDQPGAYSVSPSTSLSSSFYYFNGPSTSGSLRDINLFRNDKKIGSIDFYDYLLSGKVPNDIRLQMDDVIFIPPRGKTVTIKGDIKRNGHYELKNQEGLKDLIQIAGGLSVTAYMNRAQIKRIIPVNMRSELGLDRMVVDVDLMKAMNNNIKTEIFDGDTINIFSITNLNSNYVTLTGPSVSRSGVYQLIQGMKVLDLINAADGLLNNAYMDAHIKRINNDLTFELIKIDLDKVLANDPKENIELNFMDELIIYDSNNLKNAFSYVSISGPVKNPGFYNLEKGKNLDDLIIMAGGFSEEVRNVKITVARSIDNNFYPEIFMFPINNKEFVSIDILNERNNYLSVFSLTSYDMVSIYSDPRGSLPDKVHISGAVFYPGDYPIRSKNEKVSDIIKRSGGILNEAYPMASLFIRNNNRIKLSFDHLINNSKSSEDFFVMSNDSIYISKKSNTVQISGEVNQPGVYKHFEGYGLKEYIKISGGYTTNAEKKEIWISYPDGTSKQYKGLFLSPKVYDSSVINVGRKLESEPLDKTAFAKELASIASDFLQILITTALLINQSQ